MRTSTIEPGMIGDRSSIALVEIKHLGRFVIGVSRYVVTKMHLKNRKSRSGYNGWRRSRMNLAETHFPESRSPGPNMRLESACSASLSSVDLLCQFYLPRSNLIKMPIQDMLILGAGPCGLSAAIALAKISREPGSPPIKVTMVEVKARPETIGGTINLTPLEMRYLDNLGAGPRLRKIATDLHDGLDYVSLRTGYHIGNIWGGIGSIRVIRHALVESLLQTLMEEHASTIQVLWGKRVGETSSGSD
jgi:hypothetical protein